MIRVNLLPQKREARRETGSQAWLVVMLACLFFEAVGLFLLHQYKRGQFEAQLRTNQEVQAAIDRGREEIKNHAKVKAELAVYKAREEAIEKLQAGRTGPTSVMLELSKVLTVGKGPTVDADRLAQLRKDNPLAVPNPAWDSRRLWLTAFKENERVMTLEGLARDGEDVSELARRLALSSYFTDVKLLPASKTKDSETKVELLKFQLSAKVQY
jgi:type IV pilus assembly protein PilN